MNPAATNEFGRLLKNWRRQRGRSQLDLALDADVSSRHLSFIENGRATPSRAMVLKLVDALDIPLRERNAFLHAAGYASLYRQSTLDDRHLEPALDALRFMLEKHEPYPAFVVDRLWNLLLANDASRALLTACALPPDLDPAVSSNLLRLTLHPEGLRPSIENWVEVAGALIVNARLEAGASYGDDPLKDLLREVLRYPGVDGVAAAIDTSKRLDPVITLNLKLGGRHLSWFSIIATFGTPQDVTLQEIRLETFAPADEHTRRFAEELAAQRGVP